VAVSLIAGVVRGTGVVVIARCCVDNVGASRVRFARIIGARLYIVAIEGSAPRAGPIDACIIGGAQAVVVAWAGVGGGGAANKIFAGVIGAEIVVVTRDWLCGYTDAIGAGPQFCAWIAVIAGALMNEFSVQEKLGQLVGAASVRIAGIARTFIGIIAVRWTGRRTGPRVASILGSARVAVIAGQGVGGEHTARIRVASIVGTGVVVITHHGVPTRAGEVLTEAPCGAQVPVVTFRPVGGCGLTTRLHADAFFTGSQAGPIHTIDVSVAVGGIAHPRVLWLR